MADVNRGSVVEHELALSNDGLTIGEVTPGQGHPTIIFHPGDDSLSDGLSLFDSENNVFPIPAEQGLFGNA